MRRLMIRLIFILSVFCFASCQSHQESQNTAESESIEISLDSSSTLVSTEEPSEAGWFYSDDYLYGLKNYKGEIILNPQFKLVGSFHNGLAPVCSDDIHGFCDTNGTIYSLPDDVYFSIYMNEMAGGFVFDGFTEERIVITNSAQNKFGFISTDNKIIAPCKYDVVSEFSEGYACVGSNEKYGYIDLQGKEVIELHYNDAKSFSESKAAVQLENGLYGFINKQGEIIIEALFVQVEEFHNGLCMAYYPEGGGIYFINTKGETEIEGPFDEAYSFYSGTTLVRSGEKCYYIDLSGAKTEDADCDGFLGC
ncbi:MAG: WG repeat-containing protein [Crocinitomicaceae bacterium]|nr:WG repeat-containing protein [Crocinitomicaceae bacterium]MBK6950568.1 WG repeat-containing protein [Crocinitomicaceae bacterium]